MENTSFNDLYQIMLSIENIEKKYSNTELKHICKLFIENIVGVSYQSIYSQTMFSFNHEQNIQWQQMLQELHHDKPFQYILGETWFCQKKIKLNKYCLIPRPETEDLVNYIVNNFIKNDKNLTVIDFCTGSGCIAISLKLKFPNFIIWATDDVEEALNQAQENARIHHIHINFMKHDLLKDNLNQLPTADVLVCNPPYIPQSKKTELDSRVVQFEPEHALFVPDDDPLIFYKKLLNFINKKMLDQKMVLVECELDHIKAVYQLFKITYNDTYILKDRYEVPRFVMINNTNLISLQ